MRAIIFNLQCPTKTFAKFFSQMNLKLQTKTFRESYTLDKIISREKNLSLLHSDLVIIWCLRKMTKF